MIKAEKAAGKIKEQYPQAVDSKLANPPIKNWREALQKIQEEVGGVEAKAPLRSLKTSTVRIRGEVNRYLDLYAAHSSFDQMVEPVELRLDQVADHPSGAAAEPSAQGYRLLDEAKVQHQKGEIGFADLVSRADELAVAKRKRSSN